MKTRLSQKGPVMSALVLMAPVLSPAQNLFVANAGTNTIEEFVYDGGALSTNGMVFANVFSGLNGPSGLAF
ncbi:MAG: hypothetical protein ACREDQ_09490, partial [Limisphaerales bacterium]